MNPTKTLALLAVATEMLDRARVPEPDVAIIDLSMELYLTRPIHPIKAERPWVKWKQHPKGPTKNFKKARRQPGT